MRIVVLLGLSLHFLSAVQAQNPVQAAFENHFRLIPAPRHITVSGERGVAPAGLSGILLKGKTTRPVLYGQLQSLPLVTKPGPGVLTLNLVADSVNALSEKYQLVVKDGRVEITAPAAAGLFYGCITLEQLLRDASLQQIAIPACEMADEPDIAYRAIHLDLKHHLDAAGYYYSMIDRLARVKINAIIVEFEDKLRYRKAAIVGAADALSVEEFASLSRYAKKRNIEISPLVQGLGHAAFILKHDEYKELRDTVTSDWSFDPMNPKTYELQFSLYDDALAATPGGKYLHVGGDEVGHLGMSAAAKRSGLTPTQLQLLWLKKVCDYATAHGRIPIFWDDMLFKLAGLYQTTWDPDVKPSEVEKIWASDAHKLDENLSLFPRECVYMRWNYSSPDIPGNHRAIDWYKTHHLHVMAATATQTMWPMLPRDKSNADAIRAFCKMTAEGGMDGILCTAWDDCSPHFETYWRGFYDFAYFSWNNDNTTPDQVHARFRHRFYSPALADSSNEFEDLMEKALPFWETALIEGGSRQNYPTVFDLIDLPAGDGKWRLKYKTRIQQAKAAMAGYDEIARRIAKADQLSSDNHYTLALMREINALQIYPAKLLLLLDGYDSATEEKQKSARDAIRQYVVSFSDIRYRYEQVFSETRILNNPAGYLPDQNQHAHLANGTVTDDWMFVYELAENRKILEWLDR